MVMHRNKDYWGPDAEVFDPERFLDERVKLITKNPFMFLPFNGGKCAIIAYSSRNEAENRAKNLSRPAGKSPETP